MKFKRSKKKAFTREEFEQVEQAAIAEDNQLVAQMAGVMLDASTYIEKQRALEKHIIETVRNALVLGKYSDSLVDRGYKQLEELANGLWDGSGLEPELLKIHWEHGIPYELQFRSNWAMTFIAAGLADQFKKEDGSYWSNITCVLNSKGQTFEVTVQRKGGKTVKEIRDELEAKLAALQEKYDELKFRMDSLEK